MLGTLGGETNQINDHIAVQGGDLSPKIPVLFRFFPINAHKLHGFPCVMIGIGLGPLSTYTDHIMTGFNKFGHQIRANMASASNQYYSHFYFFIP
jgi:hypothetical protein